MASKIVSAVLVEGERHVNVAGTRCDLKSLRIIEPSDPSSTTTDQIHVGAS
jgi:hypothetical protein